MLAELMIEVVKQDEEFVLRLNMIPYAVWDKTEIHRIAEYFNWLEIGASNSILLPRGQKPFFQEEENAL